MKIPKIIHYIWLGSISNIASEHRACMKGTYLTLKDKGWEIKLWTEAEIAREQFQNQFYINLAENIAEKSDLIRMEILYRYGGVYIDHDYEFLKDPEELFGDAECILTSEHTSHLISNAFLATIPQHPFFRRLIDSVPTIKALYHLSDPRARPWSLEVVETTGPGLYTYLYEQYQDKLEKPVTFIEHKYLHPDYTNPDYEKEAYGVHRQFGVWWKSGKKEKTVHVRGYKPRVETNNLFSDKLEENLLPINQTKTKVFLYYPASKADRIGRNFQRIADSLYVDHEFPREQVYHVFDTNNLGGVPFLQNAAFGSRTIDHRFIIDQCFNTMYPRLRYNLAYHQRPDTLVYEFFFQLISQIVKEDESVIFINVAQLDNVEPLLQEIKDKILFVESNPLNDTVFYRSSFVGSRNLILSLLKKADQIKTLPLLGNNTLYSLPLIDPPSSCILPLDKEVNLDLISGETLSQLSLLKDQVTLEEKQPQSIGRVTVDSLEELIPYLRDWYYDLFIPDQQKNITIPQHTRTLVIHKNEILISKRLAYLEDPAVIALLRDPQYKIRIFSKQDLSFLEEHFQHGWIQNHYDGCVVSLYKGSKSSLEEYVEHARSKQEIDEIVESANIEKKDIPVFCRVNPDSEPILIQKFIEHYFKIGATKIFFVDRGENSFPKDSRIFVIKNKSSTISYINEEVFNYLIPKVCKTYENWMITVDLDEHLVFPEWETQLLQEELLKLEKRNIFQVLTPCVEMYSKNTLENTHIDPSTSLLEQFPFYEIPTLQIYSLDKLSLPLMYQSSIRTFEYNIYTGGPRDRVRGIKSSLLNKVSLVKYNKSFYAHSYHHFPVLFPTLQEIGAFTSDPEMFLLHFRYCISTKAKKLVKSSQVLEPEKVSLYKEGFSTRYESIEKLQKEFSLYELQDTLRIDREKK